MERRGSIISEHALLWTLQPVAQAVDLDAARHISSRAASNAGLLNAVEASMTRAYTNEMVIRITNQALHVVGGYGYL